MAYTLLQNWVKRGRIPQYLVTKRFQWKLSFSFFTNSKEKMNSCLLTQFWAMYSINTKMSKETSSWLFQI